MAFTKIVGAGIHTLSNIASHNIHSSGIITATKFVGQMENDSGISTFYDLKVTNNLTVEGTTTTLDTNLIGVDRVDIGANSNTDTAIVGIQSGTADIVNLFDGTTEVVTVVDGGSVGIGTTNPKTKLNVYNRPHSDTGGILVQNANYTSDLDKAYLIAGTQNWTGAATDWNSYGFQHKIKSDDNGTPRLTIDASGGGGNLRELISFMTTGRVGIGTNTPNAQLDVYKTGNATVVDTIITRTSGGGAFAVQCSDVAAANPVWALRTYSAEDLVLSPGGHADANEKVRIKADTGNVGIGTDDPKADLEVYNVGTGITATSVVRGENAVFAIMGDKTNTGASETDARLVFSSDGDVSPSKILTSPLVNHGFEIALINEEPGSGLRFHDGTAKAERLRITSAGFVGIGTVNQIEAPLHVASENSQGINAIFGAKDFILNDNYNYTDANIALQGRDVDNNDTGAGVQFTVRNTNNTNWLHGAITMDVSGNYIFKNGGAGTTGGTEKLRIEAGGNVGIGTNDPDQTFHVHKGTAGANASSDSNAVITVENSDHSIIQMLSPANKSNRIMFGDPASANVGQISYDHNIDHLSFKVNDSNRLTIHDTGEVSIENSGFLNIQTGAGGNYGVQEALRIDNAGADGDRALQFFEYHNNGGRWHSINNNLYVRTGGSDYIYTQGNWGGSSMIRFVGGTIEFLTDKQVSAGSTDNITPTQRLKITESGFRQITGYQYGPYAFVNNTTKTTITLDDPGDNQFVTIKLILTLQDVAYRQGFWQGEYTIFASNATGGPGAVYYLKEHWQANGSTNWSGGTVTVAMSGAALQFTADNGHDDANGNAYVTILDVVTDKANIGITA
jgi:hypothetical protein